MIRTGIFKKLISHLRKAVLFLMISSSLFLLIISCSSQQKTDKKQSQEINDPTLAAREVIRRLIGRRADEITLEISTDTTNFDSYVIQARDGKVLIKGTSTVALTFGFYQYLKKATNSMVTWGSASLHLPQKWPEFQEVSTSPYQYRYFLNVVTYGYTTVYWDWERWEKEIDWMALHGINMPLTPIGNEEIYRRTWKSLGLNDDLQEFFSGPAYLPWHRMGNLNRWDGPLPESWHQDQIKLQHKILDRMHELGFKTITPGFAGFVPATFKQQYADAEIDTLKWGGFSNEYNTYFLKPTSPYFAEIGKRFISEWEKEFGKTTHILSDSFNEMDVPVPKNDPDRKYEILADYGQAIYSSIKGGNPDAVWVTQGWTFGWQNSFWDKKTLKAMLSKIPDDKMIILDLANEYPDLVWNIDPLWQQHEGFYGKKWIYSYVPNFGGKNTFTGVLDKYATGSANALNSVYSGNLVGFGSAPEGIENNEVVYELLSDMGWTTEKINLDDWIKSYCESRYGFFNSDMEIAWNNLRSSVYSSFSPYPRFLWQLVTPDDRRKGSVHDSKNFRQAVRYFLDAGKGEKLNQLYLNDALELSAFYLGSVADSYYKRALSARTEGKAELVSYYGDKTINLLMEIDRLLASHSTARLDKWLDKARDVGKTPRQKDYYESDAKRLITVWGGVNEDYAARVWSGLIRDYYVPRIKFFLSDDDFDIGGWQNRWVEQPGMSEIEPFDNPFLQIMELVERFPLENSGLK